MKKTIFESYQESLKPTEKLDEARTLAKFKMANLEKWAKVQELDSSTEDKTMNKVHSAIGNIEGAVDNAKKILGDAISPGFAYALKKDLKTFAASLHPG